MGAGAEWPLVGTHKLGLVPHPSHCMSPSGRKLTGGWEVEWRRGFDRRPSTVALRAMADKSTTRDADGWEEQIVRSQREMGGGIRGNEPTASGVRARASVSDGKYSCPYVMWETNSLSKLC